MDLRQRVKRFFYHYSFLPKKRLGQNFVVNVDLLQGMISHAHVTSDDIVLEVGAGFGFLTRLLSQKCKRVIAVEIDPQLVSILKGELNDLQNVDLIEGDIFKVSIPPFNKVVSTPPYSVASPLLFWLLERKFDCAVLTFQKEFAERLTASVGSKNYGRLTVTTFYRAETELLNYAPREMFYPQPEVDSMVVRLNPRESPFQVEDEETFLELLRTLFTQRNKKVRNALIPFMLKLGVKKERAMKLTDSIVFHAKRVRELAPEDFGVLSNEIVGYSQF